MLQQLGKEHLKLKSSAQAILLLVYRQPQTVVIINTGSVLKLCSNFNILNKISFLHILHLFWPQFRKP